jgi:hypothetical protein
MTTTAVVLANITRNMLQLSKSSSLFENRHIQLAINFCGTAENIIIALNQENDQCEYESLRPHNCTIKFLPETEGALATIGLTLDLIPEIGNIVVVPTNAYISEKISDFVNFMKDKQADVGMAVIQSNSEELSYISEVGGIVVEIHEKEVVGSLACAGIYFFSSKKILLECIHWTLLNDVRKNGLLYIAPAMNYCITKGMRVIPFPVRLDGYERYKYEIG